MATDTSSGSSVSNFLKAILLVALAILLLRVLGGVLSWLFGVIITAVVILAIGALIFGVLKSMKK